MKMRYLVPNYQAEEVLVFLFSLSELDGPWSFQPSNRWPLGAVSLPIGKVIVGLNLIYCIIISSNRLLVIDSASEGSGGRGRVIE
jgi:hypothetical protein